MKLRKLVSVLLAAVFIFSTAAVAMAQDSTQAKEEDTHRSFVGTVTQITETEDGTFQLEIKTDDGETVSINMIDDTRVKVPGEPSADASDLSTGDRAVVLAEKKADDAWQATHLVVKPSEPTVKPCVGAVISVEETEEGTIPTIQLPNGKEKTIQLPPDAQVPEIGDVVTAFTGEKENKNVPPMARGLVNAEHIRQRIQEHLRQVSSGEVLGMVQNRIQERVQELSNILKKHMDRHMKVLDEVLQRVPEQAQEAIKRARERSRRGMKRALEAIHRAQGRVGGPPEDAGRPEGTGPGQTGGPNGNGKPEDKGPPGQTGQFGKEGHPTIEPRQPGSPGGNQTSEEKGPSGQTGQFGKEGHPTIKPRQSGGPGGNQTSEEKGPSGQTGQFGKEEHPTSGAPPGPPVSPGQSGGKRSRP